MEAIVQRSETLPVRAAPDIVLVRQRVRDWAASIGFSLVDQTKLVTAASELARNMVDYGGGGTCRLDALVSGIRKGLRLTFEDKGPGITDIELAMKDGYTSGKGMGLGLGGAKRLASDFDIWSRPGEGTRVTIARWK